MKSGAGHPAHLVTGLALWFVWLCLVYGGAAVGCTLVPPAAQKGAWNGLNGALFALTAVFVTGFLVGAWRAARAAAHLQGPDTGVARQRFFARATAVLHGVAAVSTLVVSLPLFVFAPCV